MTFRAILAVFAVLLCFALFGHAQSRPEVFLRQNIQAYQAGHPSSSSYVFVLFLNNDTSDGSDIFIAKTVLDGDLPFHRGDTVSLLLPHAPEYVEFYPRYYTAETRFMLSADFIAGYELGQDWFEPANMLFPNARCSSQTFDQGVKFAQVSVYASESGGYDCSIVLSQ